MRTEPATTCGLVAIRNLEAQIEGLEIRTTLTVADRAVLVDLIALRGHIRSCIADSKAAAALADGMVRDAPSDGQAFFARARTRCVFHLFSAALGDLDLAQQYGMDAQACDDERAGIFLSVGRCDEALEMRCDAAARRPSFQSLGALAAVHAERREHDLAEQCFAGSRERYRGTSPFPLAMLDFQRGHMWFADNDLRRARTWFAAVSKRLPEYAPAQGHLAEIDAALGAAESAIARLRELAISSDDPDYAAQLSRILESVGQVDEAHQWRCAAATRYEQLVSEHLAAFSDHAAEFWLMGNADPARALHFAKINLAARGTIRARELFRRAALAACAG